MQKPQWIIEASAENSATIAMAPRPVLGIAARRPTSAAIGGESAMTYPPTMMKVICIVKGIRLQNPDPKFSAMDRGAAPMQSAAAATIATASMAKAKASGNQRSDHAQQRCAARARSEWSTAISRGVIAFMFSPEPEAPSIRVDHPKRHPMSHDRVLIVGAGPTGLVLALWLTHLKVPVRLIDGAAEPGTSSRALAVQARTLELYRAIDLAQTVVDRGHRVSALNLWVAGKRRASAAFGDLGAGLSPYPFRPHLPAGRARATADRAARRPRRFRGAPLRARGFRGVRRHGARAPEASRTAPSRYSRPRTSPAATARTRPCARRSASDSAAAPMIIFSMWPTCRPRGLSSTANIHVAFDAADFLAVFASEARGRRASGRHGAG